MPVLYRIIKYEAETQEELEWQLENSIIQGHVFKLPKLTITVKDRNDDPNEQGFFDSCIPSPVNGMITKKQLRDHLQHKAIKEYYNEDIE